MAELIGVAPQAPATVLVGPHAGYMYSGNICGETYAGVRVPRRAVLLCPNHTGRGAPRSIWSGGPWVFPGFQVEVDEALRDALVEEAGLEPDRNAHLNEHALEVHLPFLHARRPDAKIAAITLQPLGLSTCRAIGEGLARVIQRSRLEDEDVLIVASTDMSHYEPAPVAAHQDHQAIDRLIAVDPEGLYQTVRERGISMCGYVPTTVALVAARALGATRGELVRYGHSGETTGEFDRVVGYAGVVVR